MHLGSFGKVRMSKESTAKIIDELRALYPRFSYDCFSWTLDADDLVISYQFSVEPDIVFTPSIRILDARRSRIEQLDTRLVNRLVFNLGMVEMISYWKATCSPVIQIHAASLDEDQLAWWKKLLIAGLGEFFYVNQIDFRSRDFVRLVNARDDSRDDARAVIEPKTNERTLVLTSGGKDTALTLSLMQAGQEKFGSLMLNPTKAALDLAHLTDSKELIIVRRTIAEELLELNRKGFLNGHTPFSSYLAFLSVLVAVLFEYTTVIVSNERSSNEGNAVYLDGVINHQYTKTFEFERDFADYSFKYLTKTVNYFSFLRPLYEIQIARMLSQFPETIFKFKSCNKNYKMNSKCGACPKCLAVYIMFFPFLERDTIEQMFESAPFENLQNLEILKGLVGAGEHKPFECVGTFEETLVALFLGLDKAKTEYEDLPPLWEFVERSGVLKIDGLDKKVSQISRAWNTEHRLTPKFEVFLRDSFEHSLVMNDAPYRLVG